MTNLVFSSGDSLLNTTEKLSKVLSAGVTVVIIFFISSYFSGFSLIKNLKYFLINCSFSASSEEFEK